MLEVYKGLSSAGKLLPIILYAKNWISMKVPMEIDLRRASFTLYQFRETMYFAGDGGLGSGVGRSSGPVTPFKIIARVSVARDNCDWDKAAIFSRSCFLVGLSLSPSDSSFILLISRETCTANISGKLCHNDEHLQAARARGQLTKKRKWKTLRPQYCSAPGCHVCTL